MSQKIYSTGEVAALCGTDRDRINYAIKSRRIIPDAVAGGRKLFTMRAVEAIRQVLAEIKTRQMPAMRGLIAGIKD